MTHSVLTGTSKSVDCKDIRSLDKAKNPLETYRSTYLTLLTTQATCAADFR